MFCLASSTTSLIGEEKEEEEEEKEEEKEKEKEKEKEMVQYFSLQKMFLSIFEGFPDKS